MTDEVVRTFRNRVAEAEANGWAWVTVPTGEARILADRLPPSDPAPTPHVDRVAEADDIIRKVLRGASIHDHITVTTLLEQALLAAIDRCDARSYEVVDDFLTRYRQGTP